MTQLLFPESVIGGNTPHPRRRAISRDEMNLAEFPLTVLSTRVNSSLKTLEFSDTLVNKNGENVERKWIITGADKFGLPTASDDEVLLGLMKLTVEDEFRARKVYFSRYELLKILRWTTEGRSYTRLQRALDRLSGVRIKATNAFYDNESKSHSTRNFGIVDAYEINDGRSSEAKPSFFEWSEAMFKSFQVGFIKKLDLEFYLNLSSAISKRLYRFLDKHFWYRSRLTMNLFVLAHEKVGISRNYQYASSLRQQLDPALAELKTTGFISGYEYSGKGRSCELTVISANARPRALGGMAANGRTVSGKAVTEPHVEASNRANISRDVEESLSSTDALPPVTASVTPAAVSPVSVSVPNIAASQVATAASTPSAEEDYELEQLLIARGLQSHQARRLVQNRSSTERQRMRDIIAHYDRLRASNSHLVSRSPIGFLYRAMERPTSFVLPGENAGFASGNFNSGKNFSARNNDTRRGQGTIDFRAPQERPSVPARDRLTELQAQYLEIRKRAMQQMRLEVEPELLKKLREEVEAALSKIRKLITPTRFEETLEHGIEERLAKLFAYPDFDEWLQQQRLNP